jgi:hypothetical protein
MLTYRKGRTWWFLAINNWWLGRSRVIPGPGGGDLSCPCTRVWIIYTYWQLKRRLREREECSPWNTELSHICCKSPKLSCVQPVSTWLQEVDYCASILSSLKWGLWVRWGLNPKCRLPQDCLHLWLPCRWEKGSGSMFTLLRKPD